jgi:carbon monoxide dehydrogenase subunit G
MASIHREIVVEDRPERVWDAIRDVGALHIRLVPGFVTGCRLDGDARIVTFANGMVAREPIIDLDDHARRLVWSTDGGPLTHYNASVQVFAEHEGRTRVVWIADLLPNEMAETIGGMIDQGMSAMKRTLDAAGRARDMSAQGRA